MRLVDAVIRRGHLSEAALIEALLSGDRPAHLDRCGRCAGLAIGISRWIDGVGALGVEVADEVFPAERLAVQQAQILRRLEQLDQPKRIIAFPRQARAEGSEPYGRRVAPAWVGVAAAAGLVLGVIGGQLAARMGLTGSRVSTDRAATVSQPSAAPGLVPWLLDFDLENTSLRGTPAGVIDEMTPRLVDTIVSTRAGG